MKEESVDIKKYDEEHKIEVILPKVSFGLIWNLFKAWMGRTKFTLILTDPTIKGELK